MRLSDRGMAPTSAPRRRQDLRTGLQMLLQPRHQLDQVAGPEAAVELPFENIVPAVAAGAGRAGQGEEIGAAGDPAGGPALDGRGLDLLVGEHAEQLAEALDLLLVDLPEGLGRDVAAGDAVPPVEITASIAPSAIQALSWAIIAGISSRTMARAATRWPSRTISSARVRPDLSSASVRVSETVRTAMLTGRNGLLSSIRAIRDGRGLRARGRRLVDRPTAARQRVQRRHLLPQRVLVEPVVGEDALDELAGLAQGDALHEQQRIFLVVRAGAILGEVARAGIVGDGQQHEVALDVGILQQRADISLCQREIQDRIEERQLVRVDQLEVG